MTKRLNFRWGAYPDLGEPLQAALLRGVEWEVTFLRARRSVEDFRPYAESVREHVARWYGVAPQSDHFLLTTGSAHGILTSLALLAGEGAGVLISDLEFGDFYEKLQRGRRARLRCVKLWECAAPGEVCARFEEVDLQGIELVLLSPVSYLGHRLPISEVVSILRRRRPALRILLDDSQGFFHLPLDLSRLDVDLVANDFHKRVQSAPGLGSLWVRRPEDLDRLASWVENPLAVAPAHLEGGPGRAAMTKHCLSGLVAPALLPAHHALSEGEAYKGYARTSTDLARRFAEALGRGPRRLWPGGEGLRSSIVCVEDPDGQLGPRLLRAASYQECELWFDAFPEEMIALDGDRLERPALLRFMFDALPGRNELAQVHTLVSLLQSAAAMGNEEP